MERYCCRYLKWVDCWMSMFEIFGINIVEIFWCYNIYFRNVMGNRVVIFVRGFWLSIKFWRLYYIVMLGFDRSGKMVILYWSKWNDWKERIFLILVFNVEMVFMMKDVRLKIWDVSGKEYICLLWKVYVC